MDDLTDFMRYEGVSSNQSTFFTNVSERVDLRLIEEVYFVVTIMVAPVSLATSCILILSTYAHLDMHSIPNIFTMTPLAADILDSMLSLFKIPHSYAGEPHSESECIFVAMLGGLSAYVDALIFLAASLEWYAMLRLPAWTNLPQKRKKVIARALAASVWLFSFVVSILMNTTSRKTYLFVEEKQKFCVAEETWATRLHYAVIIPLLLCITALLCPFLYVICYRLEKRNSVSIATVEAYYRRTTGRRTGKDAVTALVATQNDEERKNDTEVVARTVLFVMTAKFFLSTIAPVLMRSVYETSGIRGNQDWMAVFFHGWYVVTALWLVSLPANCIILLVMRSDVREAVYKLLVRRFTKPFVKAGRSIKTRYHQLL